MNTEREQRMADLLKKLELLQLEFENHRKMLARVKAVAEEFRITVMNVKNEWNKR